MSKKVKVDKIIQTIKNKQKQLAILRDELREATSEAVEILEDCDTAADCLEEALDSLSKYL